MRIRLRLLLLLLGLIMPLTLQAQSEEEQTTLLITIEAEDGLALQGEFFPAAQSDGRVVLLLHELYQTRASWYPYIGALQASGYHVLAVDLRGYGETGGSINWYQAQSDTQQWLNWLYLQPGIRGNAIFVMGSSMGSNLALVGCAEAEACTGAVALSPGRRYFGVSTDDAIASGTPSLLVYADRDLYPRRAIPYMQEQPGFNGTVITYSGRAHGMLLFEEDETLIYQIVAWMNHLV